MAPQDYSAEARAKAVNAPIIDKMLLLEEECLQQRVRKPVANYSEKQLGTWSLEGGGPKKPKKPRSRLPEHLRLPPMHPWMFFQSERLLSLGQAEEKRFAELAAVEGDGALPPNAQVTSDLLIGDVQAGEKAALLAEGFPKWRKEHYADFVKASARCGRDSLGAIADFFGAEDGIDAAEVKKEKCTHKTFSPQRGWCDGVSLRKLRRGFGFASVEWRLPLKNEEAFFPLQTLP